MNYASLSDAELNDSYEKIVTEKMQLVRELKSLGLSSEELNILKPKILKLTRQEASIKEIDKILRERRGES